MTKAQIKAKAARKAARVVEQTLANKAAVTGKFKSTYTHKAVSSKIVQACATMAANLLEDKYGKNKVFFTIEVTNSKVTFNIEAVTEEIADDAPIALDVVFEQVVNLFYKKA